MLDDPGLQARRKEHRQRLEVDAVPEDDARLLPSAEIGLGERVGLQQRVVAMTVCPEQAGVSNDTHSSDGRDGCLVLPPTARLFCRRGDHQDGVDALQARFQRLGHVEVDVASFHLGVFGGVAGRAATGDDIVGRHLSHQLPHDRTAQFSACTSDEDHWRLVTPHTN